MIKIIGTSHISPESVEEIQKTIKKLKPECVAVELDPMRFEALKRGETINLSAVKHIGFKNYLFAKILSIIQRYLGEKTGVIPGEEMLTAVESAKNVKGVKTVVAFIDQDIRITLNELQKIKFSEKFWLFASIFLKIFSVTFFQEKDQSKMRLLHSIDLRKVPEQKVVDDVIKFLKEKCPTLHEVLIVQRDKHMARALFELSKRYKKVVAVVGMGHKKGIKREFGKIKKKYKNSVSFSFVQKL